MLFWGGTVISSSILMSQEVTEDFGLLTSRNPTLIISLTTSMSVGFWWTLYLKLWAQQFSQSCIILEVDSTDTSPDFDCYNHSVNHHEMKEVKIQWDHTFQETSNRKIVLCLLYQCLVSIFSLFLVSFVTWYNQDLYAKRKGYKRMLFLLTVKVKEVNPKASAGRKLCFYFHWNFLKAR